MRLSLVVAVVGLIALAHALPGARCPIDFANVEAREAARVRTLRAGSTREGARPALDFELGKSTRAQVQRTLEARGASCRDDHGMLRCAGLGTVTAQFDREKLVALDVLHAATDRAGASAWLDTRERDLNATVGAATAKFGNGRIVEYRYAHYVAQLSALNIGNRVKLREQYQMLPDG